MAYLKSQQRKKEESERLREIEIRSSLLIPDLRMPSCRMIREREKKARPSI